MITAAEKFCRISWGDSFPFEILQIELSWSKSNEADGKAGGKILPGSTKPVNEHEEDDKEDEEDGWIISASGSSTTSNSSCAASSTHPFEAVSTERSSERGFSGQISANWSIDLAYSLFSSGVWVAS